MDGCILGTILDVWMSISVVDSTPLAITRYAVVAGWLDSSAGALQDISVVYGHNDVVGGVWARASGRGSDNMDGWWFMESWRWRGGDLIMMWQWRWVNYIDAYRIGEHKTRRERMAFSHFILKLHTLQLHGYVFRSTHKLL